jgi:hypothetical protein
MHPLPEFETQVVEKGRRANDVMSARCVWIYFTLLLLRIQTAWESQGATEGA